MSSGLTVADVERIAALAHLELTPDEKQLFTRQLADILAYAQQVQAIDTSGVPATAHVHVDERDRARGRAPAVVFRSTRCSPTRPDAAMEAGLFRVPRVIG